MYAINNLKLTIASNYILNYSSYFTTFGRSGYHGGRAFGRRCGLGLASAGGCCGR
jgi:hypothetical protein